MTLDLKRIAVALCAGLAEEPITAGRGA